LRSSDIGGEGSFAETALQGIPTYVYTPNAYTIPEPASSALPADATTAVTGLRRRRPDG